MSRRLKSQTPKKVKKKEQTNLLTSNQMSPYVFMKGTAMKKGSGSLGNAKRIFTRRLGSVSGVTMPNRRPGA